MQQGSEVSKGSTHCQRSGEMSTDISCTHGYMQVTPVHDLMQMQLQLMSA